MIEIMWIEQDSLLVWEGEDEDRADAFCKKLESEGFAYSREVKS